jgi:hypothetical protein
MRPPDGHIGRWHLPTRAVAADRRNPHLKVGRDI